MHSKPYFVYENKTVFIYFLTISGIIHLIFVFSTSSLSHLLKPSFSFSDNVSKKRNYVIEIDLGSEKEKEESIQDEEELKEEVESDKEDLPEEKRQLFVDTPENAIDEEPQADTNKIGEKGSIARDMYTGEDNVNDKPRLESDVVFPGEVPEELDSAAFQESGLPVDASYGEISEVVSEELTPLIVEEETVDSFPQVPEVSDGEESPVDSEIESFEKMQNEPVVQDIKAEDIDKIESATLESDVVITETEPSESMEDEAAVMEERTEKITEPVEEYTKTASIPKTMMKELIEGGKESIANKVQNNITASGPQANNIPAGDDAPFFEDKISNSAITGKESFNIKKHEYAPYYKHIKDKIRLYWLLQFGTDASINQETNDFKPVVVTFKALPSGKITDVKIVDSAGNELLASKVQSSIQNTPLDKFPEYIDEKYINVKFSYYFF
ncbi:MAG: TonB C-terminal domain-containing protein [Candidatus Scalindua sp.]|nr:TonB C-terminal domain-containing protein [Candidatus Scalindua sp.]